MFLKRKRIHIEKVAATSEIKSIMKEFNKSINVDLYDPLLFANVKRGATAGILNYNPLTKVFVDQKKSKYCIRRDCEGDSQIELKDIIGVTNKRKKWGFSSHAKCHNELYKKNLVFNEKSLRE